jgi:hypothetical protein
MSKCSNVTPFALSSFTVALTSATLHSICVFLAVPAYGVGKSPKPVPPVS